MTGDERSDADLEGLYDLAAAVIDGTASAAQSAEIEALLRSDARMRSAYLRYALVNAQLNLTDTALIARVVAPDGTAAPSGCPLSASEAGPARSVLARLLRPLAFGSVLATRSAQRVRDRPWAAAACLLAIVAALGLAIAQKRGDGTVAAVVEARNVVWEEGQAPIGDQTRIGPRRDLRLRAGTVKLAFDCGALVTMEGPADLAVLSGMRVRAARGRITTRIKPGAKGFSIETPNTLVVDQGTEFGLEVDASGQTEVVVFKGLVDLSCPGSAQMPASIKRLGQGEGMRIARTGRLSRIVSVNRLPEVDTWSIGPSPARNGLIRSVHDNIRGMASSKYYEIVHRGLADGRPAFVDRLFQWKGVGPEGLPEFLRDADYIMTFNDDKRAKGLQITVDLGPAASLYIFYDDRQSTPPWLTEQFTDTGIDVGLDVTAAPNWDPTTPLFPFSVWKLDRDEARAVSLGALNELSDAKAMYGIAATRRD